MENESRIAEKNIKGKEWRLISWIKIDRSLINKEKVHAYVETKNDHGKY